MRKPILFVIIFGVICIALGFLIGILYVKYAAGPGAARVARSYLSQQARQERQQARLATILKRFDRELQLSPEQKKEIEDILERARLDMNGAFDSFIAAMSATRKTANSQILEILNPEQKSKYQELLAQASKNWIENVANPGRKKME